MTAPQLLTSWPPHLVRHKPDTFLSCSEDWSIRLWLRGEPAAVSTLQSASKAVRSAVWSPHRSTVIASISDATLNVWDLSVRSQDPLITVDLAVPGESALTCVTFSPTANAVVVRRRSLRQLPGCFHRTLRFVA